MNNPTRIVNLRHEPYDVYIGCAGHGQDGYFGNPFPLTREADRQAVIEKYRQYFSDRLARDPEFNRRVEALRGKRLGCFCAPKPCHGNVIAEYLQQSTAVN